MKILTINCGSSSVKYQVFEIGNGNELLAKGMADRIGLAGSRIYHKSVGRGEKELEIRLADHGAALAKIYSVLEQDGCGVVSHEIQAVGHRVVHGGRQFTGPVLIDEKVIDAIRDNAKLAPLHNPVSIVAIETCQKLLPGIANVAVFDTAVHQTMPPKSYLYGLPIGLYANHDIRKYGFQGISHGYVAGEAARILNKPLDKLKIITCHLGNGSSITAFKEGKSVDTSMGMTPLEGVMMSTRSGDIDPAIVPYLIEVLGLSVREVTDLLNKESGLKGLCGKSDVRDIVKLADNGDQKAQTAIDVFVYRIQKYIGAYAAAMNGVDVIVFTAGIGENSAYLRARILANFGYLGFRLDKADNERNRTVFSAQDSKVRAMTIPTNEELIIAQETYKAVTRGTR